jgi:hypothetical protein
MRHDKLREVCMSADGEKGVEQLSTGHVGVCWWSRRCGSVDVWQWQWGHRRFRWWPVTLPCTRVHTITTRHSPTVTGSPA